MSYKGKIIPIYGDTHARFNDLEDAIDGMPPGYHVGDLGWGMNPENPEPPLFDNLRAIRGNHDNPDIAKSSPLYLGDYGVTPDGIFYVSGAKTPDFDIARRKLLYSKGEAPLMWWEDEVLDYNTMNEAVALYEKVKPEIVMTHDAPSFITSALIGAARSLDPEFGGEIAPYYMTRAFSKMLDIHRPKYWYFGHWHFNWAMYFKGCWFRCIAPNDFCIAGTLDG